MFCWTANILCVVHQKELRCGAFFLKLKHVLGSVLELSFVISKDTVKAKRTELKCLLRSIFACSYASSHCDVSVDLRTVVRQNYFISLLLEESY